jgi:hypothetical protein
MFYIMEDDLIKLFSFDVIDVLFANLGSYTLIDESLDCLLDYLLTPLPYSLKSLKHFEIS